MLKIPIKRCDCLLNGATTCKCNIQFVKAPSETVSLKYIDGTSALTSSALTSDYTAAWQTMFGMYTKQASRLSTAARMVFWHIHMPVTAPTDAFTVQLYHDVLGVDGTSAATTCNVRRWRNQLAVQKQDIMLLCADCDHGSADTGNVLLFAAVCLAAGGTAIIKLPRKLTSAAASMAQLLCSGSDARVIAVAPQSSLSATTHVFLYVRTFSRHRNRKQLAEKLLKCDDPAQYVGPSDLFLAAYTQADRV